jgi:hypothetical protein
MQRPGPKPIALAAALAAALSLCALQQEPSSAWITAGTSLASLAGSLFYAPAKILYASLGAVVGFSAYALTDGRQDVLTIILSRTIRGDYIITPEHLRGERTLAFIGPHPEDLPADSEDSAAERYPQEPGVNPF